MSVAGTASLGPQTNGKIGVVAFVFIVLTNMLGAILGVLAFVAFKPGESYRWFTQPCVPQVVYGILHVDLT